MLHQLGDVREQGRYKWPDITGVCHQRTDIPRSGGSLLVQIHRRFLQPTDDNRDKNRQRTTIHNVNESGLHQRIQTRGSVPRRIENRWNERAHDLLHLWLSDNCQQCLETHRSCFLDLRMGIVDAFLDDGIDGHHRGLDLSRGQWAEGLEQLKGRFFDLEVSVFEPAGEGADTNADTLRVHAANDRRCHPLGNRLQLDAPITQADDERTHDVRCEDFKPSAHAIRKQLQPQEAPLAFHRIRLLLIGCNLGDQGDNHLGDVVPALSVKVIDESLHLSPSLCKCRTNRLAFERNQHRSFGLWRRFGSSFDCRNRALLDLDQIVHVGCCGCRLCFRFVIAHVQVSGVVNVLSLASDFLFRLFL
mmetsp:Transcript_24112/g.29215  ORF Transcript_24112/g.29215 Transcript_24112/m.29215 type:complete len:360 (-) Transcript_24112:620-1699(-)